MKNAPIYLDYNATAPMLAEVRHAIADHLDLVGNPSSIHGFGRNARKVIEQAREEVAKLVNADPTHVTFMSGATEANNAVLFGTDVERILISAIEHPSIIDTAKEKRGVDVIPVTKSGLVDLTVLEAMLAQDNRRTLVSVMWVNNETGVIQPVEEIAVLAKRYNALFHTDAVQAAGRLLIDMAALPIDFLSLSAHKMGGPAGIGALVYNHDVTLKKYVRGGGQERRRRAGTENLLGIIGFGMAAQVAQTAPDRYTELTRWRDELEMRMLEAVPDAMIVGVNAWRIGNTIQVILPGASAEKQLMALDLAGIAVSSGSACSSGSVKPSHVLSAMGIQEELARCAIRVSMGVETTQGHLEMFLGAWVANAQRLRAS